MNVVSLGREEEGKVLLLCQGLMKLLTETCSHPGELLGNPDGFCQPCSMLTHQADVMWIECDPTRVLKSLHPFLPWMSLVERVSVSAVLVSWYLFKNKFTWQATEMMNGVCHTCHTAADCLNTSVCQIHNIRFVFSLRITRATGECCYPKVKRSMDTFGTRVNLSVHCVVRLSTVLLHPCRFAHLYLHVDKTCWRWFLHRRTSLALTMNGIHLFNICK